MTFTNDDSKQRPASFSDADLKRTKKEIPEGLNGYGFDSMYSFSVEDLQNLIARVEAAEKLEPFIVDCLNWEEDSTKPKKWWNDFAKAFEAWRKAAGKE